MRQGYTSVWTGWNATAPSGNDRLTITLPVASVDGKPIVGPALEEIIVDTPQKIASDQEVVRWPLTYPAASLDQSGATLTVRRRDHGITASIAPRNRSRRVRLIEPHAPKAGQGRQPRGLAKVRRIYFLQQWFTLAEPPAEATIYDRESLRRFARVALGDEVVADESTMVRCRHLLEQHGLGQAICAAVADLWEERGGGCAREPSWTRRWSRRRVRPSTRVRRATPRCSRPARVATGTAG